MWVLTSFGAFMPALRPPKTVAVGDPQTMQIRARRAEHLRILRSDFMPELGPTITLKGTDYEYRAYCTPAQWAAALVKIAMDIDYVSFKDTTETKYNDPELHDAYYAVWNALHRTLAKGGRYFGKGWAHGNYQPWTPPAGAKTTGIGWTTGHVADEPEGDDDEQARLDAWLGKFANGTDDEPSLFDATLEEGDDEVTVKRTKRGDIDHHWCDHGPSKGAKRRCAKRHAKRK